MREYHLSKIFGFASSSITQNILPLCTQTSRGMPSKTAQGFTVHAQDPSTEAGTPFLNFQELPKGGSWWYSPILLQQEESGACPLENSGEVHAST